MRVAHIIIAHKNPMQLLRLVQRLQHPNFDIFIHLDAKVDADDFEIINTVKNTYFIKNRKECNWGGNSLLIAIVESLKEVLSGGTEYSHISLLSGQDYPLKTVNELFNFYEENLNTNFIAYDDSHSSIWWQHAKQRYENYHFTDSSFRGRYFVQYILNSVLPKRKIPYEGLLYGSERSTWWTITGDCGKHLIAAIDENKDLWAFLRYSWGTDEFIPTTLIMNSAFRFSTVNNNMRYIDWSEDKQNPKLLTKRDYATIKQSNMLFARKFDMDIDKGILEMIDEKLLSVK